MSRSPGEAPPPTPVARVCLGVTGHRERNAAFARNRPAVEAALAEVFHLVDAAVAEARAEPGGLTVGAPRLHSLIAEGVDQMAATQALARGWQLTAILPFGPALNRAVNAHPTSPAGARALLDGRAPRDRALRTRAEAIGTLEATARVFALGEQDAELEPLFLAALAQPRGDAADDFAMRASARVALAGQMMIEHADLIVAVWDGATIAAVGGTGHTVAAALEKGSPVVWIDPANPSAWRLLDLPEALDDLRRAPPQDPEARERALTLCVLAALRPAAGHAHGAEARAGPAGLARERWRPRSPIAWHAYRRVEALFGADTVFGRVRPLSQIYERPSEVEGGSEAAVLSAAEALEGQDPAFVVRVKDEVIRRFVWADGVAARLSDTYRGGMTLNFIFSALAIAGGLAYLPFAEPHDKWLFSAAEVLLLIAILAVTFIGQQRRWHSRWFETRRLAEYLRHAPILLFLGTARAPGQWPRGAETSWPEWYARQVQVDLGLPEVVVTQRYLREGADHLLRRHVAQQADYHRGKARRLARTHASLDRLSETLFVLAVVCVGGYLALRALGAVGVIPEALPSRASPYFTFLGAALPTLAAAVSGIRFFGDFERFSAISEVAAEKLDGLGLRLNRLLEVPGGPVAYERVRDLAHAADAAVVAEIEAWQAVFGGKHVTVPA